MRHKLIKRLVISLVIAASFAFAVINYNGNDYTETFLPLNMSGATSYRYVVMSSTGITINNNNKGDTYINGSIYSNTNQTVPNTENDRYFIYYSPRNKNGTSDITGTNDWTTQSYTPVSIPFSTTGAASSFYSTSGPVDSVLTSNVDFFLINNTDYTNTTVTTLPAKINGQYYFYYGATNAAGSMSLTEYTPKLNVKVFMEGGL